MFPRFPFAALLALALLAGALIHPVAGLTVLALGLVAPYWPYVLIAYLALCLPAQADTLAASPTAIDFSGVLGLIQQTIVTVIIPVLGILVAGIAAKVFHIQGAQQQALVRDTVDNVLAKGVEYGKALLPKGPLTVDVHNALIADIGGYALAHAPDALKFFGVTDTKLEAMIIARLGAAGFPVPAIEATPAPVPAAAA